MNFVVLAILFILSGFSMKYSDDYFDVGHNNKLAIIFGIVCAVASALATIWDAGSAYIFIAILIGNLLALKVDGKHHIATLIVYVLICIICGIPELSIAVLIKKKRVKLEPIIYGGGQQFNLRSGTEDYPLISSFTVALNEYQRNLKENLAKVHLIFDFLVNELSKINQIKLHLYPNQCEYILNFSLEDKKASVVVEALSLKEIYVSSVSACSSKKEEPSYVLLALNKSLKEANNSIRLSFSKDNTIEECQIFINVLKDILNNVRG